MEAPTVNGLRAHDGKKTILCGSADAVVADAVAADAVVADAVVADAVCIFSRSGSIFAERPSNK